MPTDENSRYVRTPIPEEPATERAQSFVEIRHPYLPDDAVLEAQRCLQCAMPYCVQACPIAQDARGYILLIAERKYDEAAIVTLREDPLSSTLCKVCYHYCEDACIMHERGVPIAIRQLKRAAMELGSAQQFYVPSALRNQRIAVVGGGPAGLMAAWELGLRGYSVTIFEQAPYLGGQIGEIPKYHMDGYEIELDVARFRDLPCTFVMGKRAGTDFTLESLLADGYRAIYLAVGTSDHHSLGIPGENLPGVYPAIDLLKAMNKGPPVSLGAQIVVIGGGDVAMDAVRSALRISPQKNVTVIYRKTRDKMPAGHEESDEAEAEGVHFLYELSPVEILGTDHVEAIVVRKTTLSPPGPSGRPSVIPVPGSEQTVPCDTVIVAVGESAALAGFPEALDLQFGAQGWPEGKHTDTMTGVEGVFASGGKSVVHAMAAGTRSAVAIDAYLSRKDGRAPTPRPDPFGKGNSPTLPRGYGAATWTP
jgi:NADPH-dependent glutamate synthase beta subunit-like oxidoreductase